MRQEMQVGDFAGTMRSRVREAREALRVARESGDQHGMQVHAEDLEGLLRLAAEHEIFIEVDGGAE
ncbi:hypothetical protein ACTWPT_18515 [Nonomuraea sp. 3N208]|uniref:hypothetical protein n=1 Tax=Nonomuraea sp. 3N208 TaxID=3457421 RepID=UPI003FCD50D8